MHEFLENEKIVIKDFNDFINEQHKRIKRKYRSVLNMYNGDMWDNGKGYIGPLPVKGDTNSLMIMTNIKRMFTSRNVIAEVVDRAAEALTSKSPDWKIYNTKKIENNPRLKNRVALIPRTTFDEEGNPVKAEAVNHDRKIQEAELILSEVWSNAELAKCLKKSVTSMLLTEKGKLRIYFSFKKIGKNTDLIEAAKYVRVEFINDKEAVVLDDGVDKLSIVEISSKEKKWEISFTDDNGMTYIGSVSNKNIDEEKIQEEIIDDANSTALPNAISDLVDKGFLDLSSPLDLKGEITVDEIQGDSYVTESMLQNNRALNLALSLGVGILVESGYAEMVTTNVALKTKKTGEYDDEGNEIEKPVAIERGPTSLTNLVGEQTMNPQTGEVTFQQPGVYWKEPSPLKSFIDGESLYYQQILAEARQTHVLMDDDATASGESRVQAKQGFLNKVLPYKPSVDNHGSWLLNTILNIVAILAGKSGYFKDYKVLYESKTSVGDLAADEKNVVISMYTAEPPLISRESAMVLLGTEEPLIEIDKIRLDQAEKLDNQITRLKATAKFGNMALNGQPKELPDGSKLNEKKEEK